MAVKQLSGQWSRKDTVKSIVGFMMHTLLLILVMAAVLFAAIIQTPPSGAEEMEYFQYFESDKFLYFQGYMKENGADYLYALFAVMLLLLITYFYFLFEDKEVLGGFKYMTMLFLILDLYFVISYYIGKYISVYARPVAFVGLMAFALSNRKNAIFMNIVSALLVFIVDTFSGGNGFVTEYYSSLIIAFSSGMLAIFLCTQAKTRFATVGIGIIIVFPIDLIVLLLEISSLLEGRAFASLDGWQGILQNMGFGLFGGVTSAILFLVAEILFEAVFNRLTVFRLYELTSENAKLLKMLKEKAPASFNHSAMVANLAVACAQAIGENADYARAAAYYHDVGKMLQPENFTENQGTTGYNVHDELSPEVSADLIRSHAQAGYKLIQKYHLPELFADVALQHHGTTPISYFYAKAMKLSDSEVRIEEYSYLGPKPQTKIAAIIMIADASEAAVRAKNDNRPEVVEQIVSKIIEERMDLEQFSECDITMVDLTKIRQALVTAFAGSNHKRIKYPPIKYKRTEDGTKGENV